MLLKPEIIDNSVLL